MKVKIIIIASLIGVLQLLSAKVLAQENFVIIANVDVPIESIDKGVVKRVYNGFVTQWNNGSKVKPCYFNFSGTGFWGYLSTSQVNFNRFWTKRVFSGNGIAPIEHKSNEAVIKYVSEITGAIGVIEKSAVGTIGDKCKVLSQ